MVRRSRICGGFAGGTGRRVGSDDPGERVFVGDRQGPVAQFNRAVDEFVSVGGAREEGEVSFAVKFAVHDLVELS